MSANASPIEASGGKPKSVSVGWWWASAVGTGLVMLFLVSPFLLCAAGVKRCGGDDRVSSETVNALAQVNHSAMVGSMIGLGVYGLLRIAAILGKPLPAYQKYARIGLTGSLLALGLAQVLLRVAFLRNYP